MTTEELNNHYAEELAYQEEAVKLECTLVLMPCQREITTSLDEEDYGINGFCKSGNIGFWDQTYLSKKRIQDICRRDCPFHKQA